MAPKPPSLLTRLMALDRRPLAPHGFVRIHRNALVRLAAIQSLGEDGSLQVASGPLQASLRRLPELRRAMDEVLNLA